MRFDAAIAQSVEHVIGNDEVMGPNPISSSKNGAVLPCGGLFCFLRWDSDDERHRATLRGMVATASDQAAQSAARTAIPLAAPNKKGLV